VTPASAAPRPLAGIRVLDLGQFIAIPFCGLWLATLGAEVIVVESRRRMTSRTAPPLTEGAEKDPNGSGYFNLLNGGKKSCTVDMTMAAGRDLVRQLALKVDVVIDNFSTGVLEKLGLGYESLSALNPAIIMVSNGAFGRSGPMKNARGLHSAVNLFSGVADVTGYEDGEPRILGGCIPDPLSGTYSHFAILAAIHHRNRTGEGQFVDVAMYEAMMTMIPEAVIDLTLNGAEPKRIGNRDPLKAPHGIYKCREDDSWVAISVQTDAQWEAFCHLADRPEWSDSRYADAAGRLAAVAKLDRLVEEWVASQSQEECFHKLQAIGIAAGPVLRADQLLDNEQLVQLGFVATTDHPVAGSKRQMGLPWRMDSLAVEYNRAPLLGEHTREILADILGVDDETFDKLSADGVLA
jgi:benzylsuccinate CoA-transferase BbsF subunit